MTRDEFVRLVEDARVTHPRWFDLPADRNASDDEVRFAEAQLGCVLPPDYVWLVQHFGGGDLGMSRIYSLDDRSDLYLLQFQTSGVPFVVVSDDGTGNVFGYRVLDGRCDDDVVYLESDAVGIAEALATARPFGTTPLPTLDFVAREAFPGLDTG